SSLSASPLRIFNRSWSIGMVASSLAIVAAMVARSASFCARWRSSAASLAANSNVWLTRNWRCIATRLGGAAAGGRNSDTGSSLPLKAARKRATSSCAEVRSVRKWLRSASFMVGSSSISTCPALTLCPSRTWIARTTPVSNGWMTLVRPLGMIFPGAAAMISTSPSDAQAKAKPNSAMIVTPIARPIGEGGASTISSAAGRNASSCLSRRFSPGESGVTFLAEVLAGFMDSGLQEMERGIAGDGLDQIVMAAILDNAPRVDGDDPVGAPYGREPVGDDKDGAALGDLLHVLPDHPLALIVERARRLVEDQDPGVGDQSTRDS